MLVSQRECGCFADFKAAMAAMVTVCFGLYYMQRIFYTGRYNIIGKIAGSVTANLIDNVCLKWQRALKNIQVGG